MSIITEALKKAEKKRESVTTVKLPFQEQQHQPHINITHVSHHKINYVFVAALIVAVFIIGALFAKFSQGKAQYVVPANSPVAAQEQVLNTQDAPAPVAATPSFKVPSIPMIKTLVNSSNFKCSGIIFDDREPSAIINDSIVYVGDEIDGATIQSIQRDSVTISYEGKEFALKVR